MSRLGDRCARTGPATGLRRSKADLFAAKVCRIPLRSIGSALAVVTVMIAAAACPAAAMAQTSNPSGPRDSTSNAGAVLAGDDNAAELASAVSRLKKVGEHLFGDWDGLRPELASRGVNYDFYYWSQTAGVLSGGKSTGGDYVQSFALQADVDLERSTGIKGLSAHTILIHREGANVSADRLEDHLTNAQQLYVDFGGNFVHLGQLYLKQELFNGKVDVEAGRLGAGLELATSPLYCEFAALAICPTPRGVSEQVGYYGYGLSTWGAKIHIQASKDAYVQFGAFEVHPGLGGGNSGFNWSTDGATGVVMPIEFGWTPKFGPSHLLGHYKFGFAYDNSDYKDFLQSTTGAPLAAAGGQPRLRSGRSAFYILTDQMIYRTSAHDANGVILLANYSQEDPHTALLEKSANVGALVAGLVPTRPYDVFGVQASWLKVSHELRTAQQLDLALGKPLQSAESPLFGPSNGVQDYEGIFEAFYNFRVYRGIHIQPDFQYVIHPNATTRYGDAAIFDLDITVDF